MANNVHFLPRTASLEVVPFFVLGYGKLSDSWVLRENAISVLSRSKFEISLLVL
ncbi:hypothetical protein [Photobacterium profundum]|uniref:hypothetical protein n=1 Tax=Photobacterium profundum TaxID=74109 RepID=UPI003D149660